jgi:hypothetical protein
MCWSIDIWATAGKAVRASRDNASIFIALNYKSGSYLVTKVSGRRFPLSALTLAC